MTSSLILPFTFWKNGLASPSQALRNALSDYEKIVSCVIQSHMRVICIPKVGIFGRKSRMCFLHGLRMGNVVWLVL